MKTILLFTHIKSFYKMICVCRWLQHVAESNDDSISITSAVSWSAFHARRQPEKDFAPSLSALLPLFEDDSKSVAMIKHSMDVIKSTVQVLNPGQTPVIAFDQPLYAVAKLV